MKRITKNILALILVCTLAMGTSLMAFADGEDKVVHDGNKKSYYISHNKLKDTNYVCTFVGAGIAFIPHIAGKVMGCILGLSLATVNRQDNGNGVIIHTRYMQLGMMSRIVITGVSSQ